MTDFAPLLIADRGEPAHAIHLVDAATVTDWIKRQPGPRRALLDAMRFDGTKSGQFAILPGEGERFDVIASVASRERLTPWCLALLGERLPAGTYRLVDAAPGAAAFGWLIAQHRFDRYRSKPAPQVGARVLLTTELAAIDRTVAEAEATALVRDLVDTPAADLGPEELEQAVRALGEADGATVEVTRGDALDTGYPMIAAVGRGAARDRAPRQIELEWGRATDPRIAIVGKGVCFDSGGLDIKPASGMRWMKKDMGGAAHAIALARMIIELRLPIRLHLLIPAVENSVSATAFRPGDVIASRRGLQVEVDNTDAEGRLVLGDALTRAGELAPELIVDFATLTGAARIALGPDLPALFANDESLAAAILAGAHEVGDPLWRMPLWDGYDEMLKSGIADLANSADGPMAGAITAALFLRRFAPEGVAWAHLDTFAWRATARPGRPKGGDALGLRAIYAMLNTRFGG